VSCLETTTALHASLTSLSLHMSHLDLLKFLVAWSIVAPPLNLSRHEHLCLNSGM